MECNSASLKMSTFCTFKNMAVQSQNQFWKFELCLERTSQWSTRWKIFKASEIVFSTKPCILVLFSFHFYFDSKLYYNIHIVKRVWLWRQIISKSETFCLHPLCWYTCRPAWSNRCDKWHIVIKMPDKIGCRCYAFITVLYTPLALLRMLTALNKENSFFFL